LTIANASFTDSSLRFIRIPTNQGKTLTNVPHWFAETYAKEFAARDYDLVLEVITLMVRNIAEGVSWLKLWSVFDHLKSSMLVNLVDLHFRYYKINGRILLK
jgi:hypothetical protein